MMHLIRPDLNVNWLGKSKPFVWASTFLVVASLILLVKPGLNYGIDFTGGAVVQVKAPASWDTARVRESLSAGGLKEPSVVQLGEANSHEFLIKVQAESETLNQVSTTVEAAIKKAANGEAYEMQRVDVVGPAAGANLRNSAFLSIFFALVTITIYISFRFDARFAPGVLRALAFDVISTLGIWVLLQREFNLTVLAAVLTVAGYSCNDTIIIYDRIRDFMKSHPNWKLEDCINRSINLNLGRTVLTVLCTLFVVASLYFLGGPVLRDFALPMLIGFSISVPSAIFVANPLILYMEKRRIAKVRQAQGMTGTSPAHR